MRRAVLLLQLVVLAACGGTPPPQGSEAGVVGSPSCDRPDLITLLEGETVRRTFDLRIAPSNLVTGCSGTVDTGQIVFEIVVPGVGPHTVEARTATVGTAREVDTVLALRRRDCSGAVSDQCFDELSGDYRTNAAFTAEGGDHVFVVLTVYNQDDEGPVEIEFSASVNGPPTITSAAVVVAGTELLVDVVGGDPDGNGTGVTVTLHGPAGELIDLDGNALRDADDTRTGTFARPVNGAVAFSERTRIDLVDAEGAARALSATSAYVRTVDRAGVTSVADVVAPVRAGSVVARGEACTDTRVCPEELSCAAGTFTCEPTPTRAAICAGATPLGIATPTTMTTSTTTEENIPTGDGLFSDGCDEEAGPVVTDGRENLYVISVPAGAFDLLLTTDLPGTATDADTVLYVRTDCTDPATGPPEWCSDDIVRGDNTRSSVEALDVAEGDYFVFVERWGSGTVDSAIRYALEASLRPVLPSGQPCDPAGRMNRCSGAACSGSTRMCP